jgi:outer membrane protein assembly factor BamD
MLRRVPFAVLLLVAALLVGCSNKKVNNPLANVGSKQPDKVLFDRAMDAMKHNRFDVARMTMQTLINTYPDSEYIARAKLAVADSWYAEGGSTSLAQAEVEYKDFETFFPNMAEAAEAQLKIANIHYQEMEKPDRDFTHALRAEEEYRQLILQWPDSKLVPEAKERLMEVQEVIANPIPPPSPACDRFPTNTPSTAKPMRPCTCLANPMRRRSPRSAPVTLMKRRKRA